MPDLEHSENESRNVCARCGKPKRQDSQGRITQWISVCACDAPLDEEKVPEIQLCHRCNKRFTAGRSGSFTQWIFRVDVCRCTSPILKPLRSAEPYTVPTREFPSDDGSAPTTETLSFEKRYEHETLLGEGSTGTVSLCVDHLLGKKVAIKRVKLAKQEQIVAFQQEAKATSRLNHPNIVTVLDFGLDGEGAPYMVLDYVRGSSLKQYVKERGPFDPIVAIELFIGLSEALIHAHERNTLHRDISASNILVYETQERTLRPGSPKPKTLHATIIDFGVAAFRQPDEATLVNGEAIVGSPLYMSPDQARGLNYDERSEIYSFGCVLFEALTGRPPFSGGSSLETISHHATMAPPKLSDVRSNPQFNEQLETVIATCLAKEPAHRYQNMGELRAALVKAEVYLRVFEASAGVIDDVEEARQTKSSAIVLVTVSVLSFAVLATLAFLNIKPLFEKIKFKTKKQHAYATFLMPLQSEVDKTLPPAYRSTARKPAPAVEPLKTQSDTNAIAPSSTNTSTAPAEKKPERKLDVYSEFGLSGPDDESGPIAASAAVSDGMISGTQFLMTQGDNTTDRLRRCIKKYKMANGIVIDGSTIADEDAENVARLKPFGIFLRKTKGLTSARLKTMLASENVRAIGIDTCQVDKQIITQLSSEPRIQNIAMRSCNLKDGDLKPLTNAKFLKNLDVAYNPHITAKGLKPFANHKYLAQVNIFGCACAAQPLVKIRELQRELGFKLDNSPPADMLSNNGTMTQPGQVMYGPPSDWGF